MGPVKKLFDKFQAGSPFTIEFRSPVVYTSGVTIVRDEQT